MAIPHGSIWITNIGYYGHRHGIRLRVTSFPSVSVGCADTWQLAGDGRRESEGSSPASFTTANSVSWYALGSARSKRLAVRPAKCRSRQPKIVTCSIYSLKSAQKQPKRELDSAYLNLTGCFSGSGYGGLKVFLKPSGSVRLKAATQHSMRVYPFWTDNENRWTTAFLLVELCLLWSLSGRQHGKNLISSPAGVIFSERKEIRALGRRFGI